MTHKRVPVQLRPAHPSAIRPQHVPALPQWYPMDRDIDPKRPELPKPPPYSDAERAALRNRAAVTAACEGPYDGSRGVVVDFDTDTGPPLTYQPIGTPDVLYRLDAGASKPHVLVYRYDPDSPIHADLMTAVADAYRELRQDYTIAAREEDSHDRSAPTLS